MVLAFSCTACCKVRGAAMRVRWDGVLLRSTFASGVWVDADKEALVLSRE